MSIIYPSLCLFLFAVHLEWSLNTRVDKKIKCRVYICEIVFHFSLKEKIKCQQTVLQRCIQDVNLIAGGGGAVSILRTNCHPFPPFPVINTTVKWRFLYIPPTPFYYNTRPRLPSVLLINNSYWCRY